MSFFEVPPPPPTPESEPTERKPWWGPPDNVRGGVVALELTIGRSEQAAITVGAATAYPEGFEFGLAIRIREPLAEARLDPLMFHHRRRRGAEPGDELPAELARWGIEFSDGRKATNLRPFPSEFGGIEEQPDGPVLMSGGGGGGGSRWEQSCWVWPLPPAGPLAFVCEWPAGEIPLSRVEVDARSILEAAGRAEVLWEPDAGAGRSGGTGYGGPAVAVARHAWDATASRQGRGGPETPPRGSD
jgi:hypothetical protein